MFLHKTHIHQSQPTNNIINNASIHNNSILILQTTHIYHTYITNNNTNKYIHNTYIHIIPHINNKLLTILIIQHTQTQIHIHTT